MMKARVIGDQDVVITTRIGENDVVTARMRERDPAAQKKAITIQSDLDVVNARAMVRHFARKQGFNLVDQARISTAVSELARNIYAFAETGQVTVKPVERNGKRGIELTFEDRGPGIADVNQALQEGYSTTVEGQGMGLPSAQRFMDEFEIQSQLGIGTTIICRKWCS
jgi:serine/threonine-protein kinase RsbT